MNEKLFLRNPEESVLGKKIVKNGLILINKLAGQENQIEKGQRNKVRKYESSLSEGPHQNLV